MSEPKRIRAQAFDEIFDEGGDVTPYLDLSTARRPNQKRVNVDFNPRQLAELDDEAAYLGVSRQAVIKTLLDEAITRRKIERKNAVA